MVKVYKIEDLDCAHCAAKIEEAIRKIDGVTSATVSFLAQKMTVDADQAKLAAIEKEILAVCKRIEPDCTVHIG